MNTIPVTTNRKAIQCIFGVAAMLLWFAPLYQYPISKSQYLFQTGMHLGNITYVIPAAALMYSVLSWIEQHVPKAICGGVALFVAGIVFCTHPGNAGWGTLALLGIASGMLVMGLEDATAKSPAPHLNFAVTILVSGITFALSAYAFTTSPAPGMTERWLDNSAVQDELPAQVAPTSNPVQQATEQSYEYFNFEPITADLKGGFNAIQIGISVVTKNQECYEAVRENSEGISQSIAQMLTRYEASKLGKKEEKQALAELIKSSINNTIMPKHSIEKVLLTSFVII